MHGTDDHLRVGAFGADAFGLVGIVLRATGVLDSLREEIDGGLGGQLIGLDFLAEQLVDVCEVSQMTQAHRPFRDFGLGAFP